MSQPPSWNRVVNHIGADTTGPVVQAGTINGGVHLHSSPHPTPPPPRQIPSDASHFQGRADQLTWLDAQFAVDGEPLGAPRVGLITGTAGVGKTTLAVRWAHLRRSWFPDGQLYADMHGYSTHHPVDAGTALATFLRALGTDPQLIPADPEHRAALYRSLVDGKRLLVVLDNVSNADQVRPLLPASAGVATLVTSRNRLAGVVARNGATRLRLDALDPTEAMDLLRATAGAERVDSDPVSAARLVDLCAHLPLAVRIAAERCAHDPFTTTADLVSELESEHGRLDVLSPDDDPESAVRAVLSWSYGALDSEAAAAFRALGLHVTSDIGVDAAAVLLDKSGPQTRRLMEGLASAHMIRLRAKDRYQLHDLLRAYAIECAENDIPPESREESTLRMLAWYLHTADAAGRALLPLYLRPSPRTRSSAAPIEFDDRDAALSWYESERVNLVSAAQLAVRRGYHDIACEFPNALWSYFDLRKYWADWIMTYEACLDSSRITGRKEEEGWILNGLAIAYYDNERYDEAVATYDKALAVRQEIDDLVGVSGTLSNMSFAYRRLSRFAEALDCLRRSLEIRVELGDQRRVAITLGRMGSVYRDLGRLGDSLVHLERSVSLRRQIGDRHGEGFGLHSLAVTYISLGRYEEAVGLLREAARIHQEVGNLLGEADVLNSLGDMLEQVGDPSGAVTTWDRASSIYEAIGSPQASVVRDKARTRNRTQTS